MDPLTGSAIVLFQFHKGAIRTHRRQLRHLGAEHFNSIKVRLEPPEGGEEDEAGRNFNSIKVRLEHRST